MAGRELLHVLPQFKHQCSTFGCYRDAEWEQLYELPDGRRLWLYICGHCKFLMEDKQKQEDKDATTLHEVRHKG